MSKFVLVPGAGGAAWYWHRVVPDRLSWRKRRLVASVGYSIRRIAAAHVALPHGPRAVVERTDR